ncbi:hypothetical protein GOBAR_AA36155 [Gossypium barbadense]|uniref:Uncharacterized protein n=1 Tax=Gossypium barbadense TaxID=3634 RepID=A0A2P5W0D8_GOSBA|nr:hypothetical protein GOBAR_AA36155 [Gossypium barbadense]
MKGAIFNPQKGIDFTFNCASRHKEPSHPEQDATFPPALLRMPFYPKSRGKQPRSYAKVPKQSLSGKGSDRAD